MSEIHPGAWRPPNPLPARLETPRLTIRQPTHDDAAAILGAIDESRDTLLPWLPWAETENRGLGETHFTIESFRRSARGDANFKHLGHLLGVFDRTSGAYLGSTGLHPERPNEHEAEIGYWMRTSARRQGFATEAVRHLVSWAFTPQHEGGWGLRRLVVFCHADNDASRRVAESVGLSLELRQRESRWVDGRGWSDLLGFGVLANEWDRTRHVMRDGAPSA